MALGLAAPMRLLPAAAKNFVAPKSTSLGAPMRLLPAAAKNFRSPEEHL